MVKFVVSGSANLGRSSRPFTKEVEAQSEGDAKEKTYSVFGSQNGVQRQKVKIESVKKV
ncbi:MAG: 50S ribosomal protein L18Ae [Candidatus Bilamarchaeaceae archaeon]